MSGKSSLQMIKQYLGEKDFIAAAERLTSLSKQGWSSASLAKELGLTDAMVRHHVRIADKLHDDVKELCTEGKLKLGHARVIASFPYAEQCELADRVIKQSMSVRQLENLRKHGELRDDDPDAKYYLQLAQDLSDQLGHPLSISPNRTQPGSGFIRIQYFDLDDFDTVCKRIGLEIPGDEF
jgi:ParB-like chromosome segregation protein Spo0J